LPIIRTRRNKKKRKEIVRKKKKRREGEETRSEFGNYSSEGKTTDSLRHYPRSRLHGVLTY